MSLTGTIDPRRCIGAFTYMELAPVRGFALCSSLGPCARDAAPLALHWVREMGLR